MCQALLGVLNITENKNRRDYFLYGLSILLGQVYPMFHLN